MKKVHAKTVSRISQLLDELADRAESIECAVEDYNQAIRQLNEIRADVAWEIQAHIGERSEAWQDSERAEVYRDWLTYWEVESAEADEPTLEQLDLGDFVLNVGQLT